MEQQAWDQQRVQRGDLLWVDMESNLRNVPCQLDMDDLEAIPLSRERALGLQRELSERLGSHVVQQELRRCERTYGERTLEFRREHQQLVLGVQSTVLPKYGYEASIEGVARMMKDYKASFGDDAEITGNIKAIDSLIWKYKNPKEQQRVKPLPRRRLKPLSAGQQLPEQQQQQQQQQQLQLWRQQQQQQMMEQREEWRQFELLDANQPIQEEPWQQALDASGDQATGDAIEPGTVFYRGVPVELDMDDIHVPLTKEEVLELQMELLDKLSEAAFLQRLRACARKLGQGSVAFRREHQQLVLEVQASVLPKHGFEASLDGVAKMMEAVSELSWDEEVAANAEDIDLLIWSCGGRPPKLPAPARPPEAPRAPADEGFAWVGPYDGHWVVVGGRRWGGLAVRQSEQPDSEMEPDVLAVGAVVKELDRSGSYMRFQKILGEGPEQGWVRAWSRRATLLDPFEGWLRAGSAQPALTSQ